MNEKEDSSQDCFRGLRALMESSFPRTCPNCGRHFETAEAFLAETEDVDGAATGLAETLGGDGASIVEVFRNCPCGSTLVDFFGDRRDRSEDAAGRRRIFGKLLDMLQKEGLDQESARREVLKAVTGGKSKVLTKLSSERFEAGDSGSRIVRPLN